MPLQFHFSALCDMINQVPIVADPLVNDMLIWTSSYSGELTTMQSYIFMWHPSPPIACEKLWAKFIFPRMSLHAWNVLNGIVIYEDLLTSLLIAIEGNSFYF